MFSGVASPRRASRRTFVGERDLGSARGKAMMMKSALSRPGHLRTFVAGTCRRRRRWRSLVPRAPTTRIYGSRRTRVKRHSWSSSATRAANSASSSPARFGRRATIGRGPRSKSDATRTRRSRYNAAFEKDFIYVPVQHTDLTCHVYRVRIAAGAEATCERWHRSGVGLVPRRASSGAPASSTRVERGLRLVQF